MESKNNQEITYEKKIDCEASIIRIPVSKDYGRKIFIPSKPKWLKCEQTEDDILEISVEANPSKERKVSIICVCEGKGNINCKITQTKMIKKTGLFPEIKGDIHDNFIDAYIAGNYPTSWPTAIIVRQGVIIDAVGFKYGDKTIQIGGQGGVLQEFPLAAGEYITAISGSRVNYGGNPVYNTITFYTNKKEYSVKGGDKTGTVKINYKANSGCAVFCLYGKTNSDYLGTLGFYETFTDE